MAMTAALRDAILGDIFGSDVDIALYTVSPSSTTAGTEVTGGDYARVTVPSSAWSALDGTGTVRNENQSITFPVPAAAWGDIVALGVFVGADLKLFGAVSPSVSVVLGDDPVQFAVDALRVALDS